MTAQTATSLDAILRRTPGEIKKAALASTDPDEVLAIIERVKDQFWPFGDIVVKLYEHIGRELDARRYGLEAASALDAMNRTGSYSWLATELYLRFGRWEQALDILLKNGEIDEAIKVAQEHYPVKERPAFYLRAYKETIGKCLYHNGFPARMKLLGLLGEDALVRREARNYIGWMLDKRKLLSIDFVKQYGTKHDLALAYELHIGWYEKGWVLSYRSGFACRVPVATPQQTAELCEAAFKDTDETIFAFWAMKVYNKLGNAAKETGYAQIVLDTQRFAPFQQQMKELGATVERTADGKILHDLDKEEQLFH